MPVKKLLLLCSLSFALLAPGAVPVAQQKTDPARANLMVRRIIKNVERAINVYTSSGSLRGAVKHVGAVENDVSDLSYLLPADNPLMNAVQLARNSLTEAALISDAYRGRRRIPDEDLEALSGICNTYGVPQGPGGRLMTARCVKRIMQDVRKKHSEALAVASREGLYKR